LLGTSYSQPRTSAVTVPSKTSDGSAEIIFGLTTRPFKEISNSTSTRPCWSSRLARSGYHAANMRVLLRLGSFSDWGSSACVRELSMSNAAPQQAAARGIRVGCSMTMPNGEVEGPRRSASRATRAHTVFQRPRSQSAHSSRPPPTIVRPPHITPLRRGRRFSNRTHVG